MAPPSGSGFRLRALDCCSTSEATNPAAKNERGGQADGREEHPAWDHPRGSCRRPRKRSVCLDQGKRPFTAQQQHRAPYAGPPDGVRRRRADCWGHRHGAFMRSDGLLDRGKQRSRKYRQWHLDGQLHRRFRQCANQLDRCLQGRLRAVEPPNRQPLHSVHDDSLRVPRLRLALQFRLGGAGGSS